MDESRADVSGELVDQAGTTRRNMLIGATSIAAATAVVSSLGSGHASAAPIASQITCTMPAIGTFVLGSLQWGAGLGVGSPRGGLPRTTSDPSVSEITVTKVTDSASTGLFKALLRATVIEPVTITFLFKSGAPSMSLVLHEVIVSGFSMSTGGDTPSESLSFNFTSFELTVNSGALEYDLANNVAT